MYQDFLPSDSLTFDHTYLTLARDASTATVAVQGIAGDPDRVFSLASVTKPIAAWAVLVAVDQGKISLDQPAGPEGSTIRHLLAHASGVPSEPGEPLAAPGNRRIYSNYGFDLLGEAVGQQLGMPIQQWIREAVLEPLAMDDTEIAGSIAYSGRSSLDSLARFAMELLQPTLISADLARQAHTPQFPGIRGILPGYGRQKDNLWGLGLEIRGEKSPHWLGSEFGSTSYGHFGQAGSFIWVDPTIDQAGVFLSARAFSQAHIDVWPGLTNEMRIS